MGCHGRKECLFPTNSSGFGSFLLCLTFSAWLRAITKGQCQALGLSLQPLVSLCSCDDTRAARVPQPLLLSALLPSQTGHDKA